MTTTLDLSADVIDVRDIIERIEDLKNNYGNDEGTDEGWTGTDQEWDELALLQATMSDLKGEGGDEQWRGDWYPLTLIRESYFQDYAQELAEDIGAVNRDATWPNNCIDWEQAARELRMDYTITQIDGVTYFFR
jgi:hypothetical protein